MTRPPWYKNHRVWEAITGYLFITPAIIYFLIFQLTGLLWGFYISFTKYNLRTAPEWIGAENYIALFTDRIRFPNFYSSMLVSLKWVIMEQPFAILLPLLVALLLNTEVKGEGFFKTLFFIPVITPAVAMATAWRWILDPDMGLLNQILGTNISWLKDEATALPTLAAMSVWGAIGGSMFLWLSALKAIPNEVYEAASIDGATGARQFLSITLPLLRPTLFYAIVTGSIGAFQVFMPMYLLTNGEPKNTTLTYALLLYRHATRYDEVGTALAMAFILLVMILTVTLLQFRFLPQRYD
ncbi:MAG: carbohydrate ABC transporter permease [Bacillota bacterium]